MRNYIFIFMAVLFALIGCGQNKASSVKGEQMDAKTQKRRCVRYGMVTGIKPEKLAYYKELHAKPWPAVLEKIGECNIQNYSIYLQKIGEQYYLFSYFEYTGTDFDADMKKMAEDSTTQRWWKETDPCQVPLPEAVATNQVWTKMEEVFHYE